MAQSQSIMYINGCHCGPRFSEHTHVLLTIYVAYHIGSMLLILNSLFAILCLNLNRSHDFHCYFSRGLSLFKAHEYLMVFQLFLILLVFALMVGRKTLKETCAHNLYTIDMFFLHHFRSGPLCHFKGTVHPNAKV